MNDSIWGSIVGSAVSLLILSPLIGVVWKLFIRQSLRKRINRQTTLQREIKSDFPLEVANRLQKCKELAGIERTLDCEKNFRILGLYSIFHGKCRSIPCAGSVWSEEHLQQYKKFVYYDDLTANIFGLTSFLSKHGFHSTEMFNSDNPGGMYKKREEFVNILKFESFTAHITALREIWQKQARNEIWKKSKPWRGELAYRLLR